MAVYRDGRVQGHVHDPVHGPYAAEYTVLHRGVDTVRVHSRTCTVRVQCRVTAVYTVEDTAVDTVAYTAVDTVVYTAVDTAVYTAVHKACKYGRVHGRVHSRVRAVYTCT